MAENKKQHFVPRFYLKQFSCEAAGKLINIFNLPNKKFIKNGDLYNQCYENYYYGRDGKLENVLSVIETPASGIVQEIISTEKLPKRYTDEHEKLLAYVLMQTCRTTYAKKEMNEHTDKLLKNILGERIKEKELLDGNIQVEDFDIVLSDPMALLMKTVAELMPIAMDLSYKVLKNCSKLGFITSDNPAVKYNQLFESDRGRSHLGLASTGLQIFLPLSSKYCLLFYDEKVYRVGDRRNSVVNMSDGFSIENINALQIVNCEENIYYNEDTSITAISSLAAKYAERRRKEYSKLLEYQSVEPSEDGQQSSLIHLYQPMVCLNLRMSHVKLRQSPEYYTSGNRAVYSRNQEFVNLYSGFLEEVHKGNYTMEEFETFVIRKQQTITLEESERFRARPAETQIRQFRRRSTVG